MTHSAALNMKHVRHHYPLAAILGIAFVILKLTSVISWSWWLVLLPLYGPPALMLGLTAALFLFALLCVAVVSIGTLRGAK